VQTPYDQTQQLQTYLKCSLVWSPRFPKYLLTRTRHVVKTLKRAPNPSTTRYPIPTERGGSPPNMDSCPLYLSKGGSSRLTGDDAMMLVFLSRLKRSSNCFHKFAIGKRMSRDRKCLCGSKRIQTDPKALSFGL
jgi:hypothetical protein